MDGPRPVYISLMFPYFDVEANASELGMQDPRVRNCVSGISVCFWSCPIAFQECRNDHGTGRFRQPSLRVFAPEYINPMLLQSASELCTALHEHAIPEMEELHPKTGSRHRPRCHCEFWPLRWGQSAFDKSWAQSIPAGRLSHLLG